MRIADSARKHGVSEEDMRHAARVILRTISREDGRTLLIGTDISGRLLEIVVKDADDADEPLIIHAMPLRRGYYKYLGKG
jgi:hypothetical protein